MDYVLMYYSFISYRFTINNNERIISIISKIVNQVVDTTVDLDSKLENLELLETRYEDIKLLVLEWVKRGRVSQLSILEAQHHLEQPLLGTHPGATPLRTALTRHSPWRNTT